VNSSGVETSSTAGSICEFQWRCEFFDSGALL
jgi:hypothetical protein